MITYFVYFTILSGVLGQLAKIPLGSGNLYPLDLLVIVTVTLWALGKLVERDYQFRIPRYFLLLSLFLFWAAITLIRGKSDVTSFDFMTGSFYLIRFAFYSVFSLVVYDLKSRSPQGLFEKGMLRVLLASCVVVALAGFAQLFVYPDLSSLAAQFGYDPHKNRLVSTFLDPNFTAAYLVLGIVLLVSLKKESNSNSLMLHSIVVRLIIGAILSLALVLTFSRSGWLMLSVVLLLFGVLRSPKLLLVAFLAGFLAYFAVPRVQTRISGITDPDDSAKLRLVSWAHAVTIFEESPVFGVGFNLYRSAQERFGFFDYRDLEGGHAGAGSDSSLLLVLATTGIVGLVLFLLTLVYVFVMSFRKFSSPVGLALCLSLFGLFWESQFINSLFFPQIMLWVWVLIGLL